MAKKKIENGDSPKMTVLAENGNSSLDRLIEVYKLDRRKAKILYDNNKNNNGYMKSRVCL
jgi:Tfp pilus assembly ATPase PilU